VLDFCDLPGLDGIIGFSVEDFSRFYLLTIKRCRIKMQIRPVDPRTDLPRIVELVNTYEPEPISLGPVQRWCERLTPGRVIHLLAAIAEQRKIIGYCEIFHESWFAVGEFQVWVIVDPEARRQGIGKLLYAEAQSFLRTQEVTDLKSETRENSPEGLRFAQKRGFSVDRHQFESTLDLVAFDERPFLPAIAHLADSGIQIHTLADFGDTQAARRKLYEVNYATALDIPGVTGWVSFEEFEATVCTAEWYRPEGQFAALDGEKFIGLSAVKLMPETNGAYNLMTGVLPAHRGQKIALALKLAAIRYARQHAATYMRTNNDSLNPAILTLNQKLGYQPKPGKYLLKNRLE
jgi:GNAT superfamily N-acetyltransferase